MVFKLKEFAVRNFRSLKDIAIKDIGDLTIFIGSNSSGKSNLIEALSLFFNEFDPAPQRAIGPVSDYLWFDRISEKPIELEAKVQVSSEDLAKMVPEQVRDLIKLEKENMLSVTRQITGNAASATWLTKQVMVNSIEVIKDGQLVLGPTTKGQQVTVPVTQILGILLQNVSQLFKGAFKVVAAARNYIGAPTRFGDRVPFMQPTQVGELTTLGQSLERPQLEQWTRMEDYVKKTAQGVQDLRVITGQIVLRESDGDMRVPISLEGGGYQEVLSLMHELTKGYAVFGLEEPEVHLHPQLARTLFDMLKQVSREKQIFVSTHSTVFVDYVQPKDTWIVRRKGKETELIRVSEPEELVELLYELGIRPSDIFFANGIIFVEGHADKVVLGILAERVRPGFKQHGLSIIPIYGKASGRYRLKVWIEAARTTRIPLFVILDKDADKEAKKLRDVLKPQENLFLLRKGSIEEYYPDDRLVEALSSIYELTLEENDRNRILSPPRDKNIDEYLRQKEKDPKGWKVAVGERVAKGMTVDEIDDEIKRIVERISTVLIA